MKIHKALLISLCLAGLPCVPAWAAIKDTQLVVEGVDHEIENNIRQSILALFEDDDFSLTSEDFEQNIHQQVSHALQAYGYYTSTIKIYKETLAPAKIKISVELGTPVRVHQISFALEGEGKSDPSLRNLNAQITLKPNDIFVHEQYELTKKALLSTTMQQGYLVAAFTQHQVEIDIDNFTADVRLTLSTGPRHYFGETNFGTTTLSESLLRRFLPYHRGEVYAPEQMLVLQNRLNQSNYFKSVNVRANPDPTLTTVPVIVELEDAKPNQYTVGAGYGTDTGPRAKLGWTRRQINTYGHRVAANAQISEIYRKLSMDYIIPGLHPDTDSFKIKGGFYDDEYSEKPSQIYETGVIEERLIGTWTRQLSLFYHHERFNAYITNQGLESSLILPSISFVQTTRNNPTNPTHGRRIEITLRGSIDALFSDTTFFQAYTQWRWLHALDSTTKLLFRTELGFTVPDDPVRLPLSQRFFAGGDLSLRGYGYRSLPNEIDKDGNYLPVGGAYLGIVSIELNKTIKKPFGVFTFVDAGNAFRKFGDDVEVGTGVGVEWQTRIGPIKVALAKPLNKDMDAWRIHAMFGPEI